MRETLFCMIVLVCASWGVLFIKSVAQPDDVVLPKTEWVCTKEATASAFEPKWLGNMLSSEQVLVKFCIQYTKREQI